MLYAFERSQVKFIIKYCIGFRFIRPLSLVMKCVIVFMYRELLQYISHYMDFRMAVILKITFFRVLTIFYQKRSKRGCCRVSVKSMFLPFVASSICVLTSCILGLSNRAFNNSLTEGFR